MVWRPQSTVPPGTPTIREPLQNTMQRTVTVTVIWYRRLKLKHTGKLRYDKDRVNIVFIVSSNDFLCKYIYTVKQTKRGTFVSGKMNITYVCYACMYLFIIYTYIYLTTTKPRTNEKWIRHNRFNDLRDHVDVMLLVYTMIIALELSKQKCYGFLSASLFSLFHRFLFFLHIAFFFFHLFHARN